MIFNRIARSTEGRSRRLPQRTIWLLFLRGRLRCSDSDFVESSFVLVIVWTLIDNSLFRRIED
jgi:hypothetical protein